MCEIPNFCQPKFDGCLELLIKDHDGVCHLGVNRYSRFGVTLVARIFQDGLTNMWHFGKRFDSESDAGLIGHCMTFPSLRGHSLAA